MKQFLFTIAGVFVGLILFFVVLPMLFIMSATSSSKPITPHNAVLVLDLRRPINDQPSQSPFGGINGAISVVDVVRKLEAAETDNNVKGVLVRAPELGIAPAHAEEIRQAIIDFKSSGKFVIAHAQGFMMPTLSNYVTISAADEIWLQNNADFTATGLSTETMFLGGMFEKFGISPQFDQFYEYKNAANVYTQKDYTEAHREATTSLLGSIYNSFLAEISVDRKVPIEALKQALDTAPFSSQVALKAKLGDKIGMPEEAMDYVIAKAGGKTSSLVELQLYTPTYSFGPKIAIIGGEGEIIGGPQEENPFSNAQIMNSDRLAQAIREATDNDSIKAIVFRVSSPGGSAIASEQIWSAIERAKAMKKPVVISMGAYAASGGYFVSVGADKIVAMPSSITGSIGVLGGKLAVNAAIQKYSGANISSIEVGGPFVGAYSSSAFTNSQREQFHKSMERIYIDFTSKVAAGRKLPIEKVQEIAKGRVWTGAQAKNIALVDTIGGLRQAIMEAKALAKIDAKKSVETVYYPQPEDPFKALTSLLGGSTEAARALASIGTILGDTRLNEALMQIKAANDNSIIAKENLKIR